MPALTEKDTPLKLMNLYRDAYPVMDDLRHAPGLPHVPVECYAPIAAGIAVLTEIYGLSQTDAVAKGSELTAIYIWQKSRIIYNFDDDLTAALAEQAMDLKDTDVLPINLLLHPVYPCVYIKSGYFRQRYNMDGFFYWIEWDTDRREYELRWQFVTPDMEQTVGYVMHLSKPTIGECVEETMKEIAKYDRDLKHEDMAGSLSQPLSLALEMILYLSADNCDREEDREQRAANRRAKAKSKNWRKLPTPESIRMDNVGIRVGAAIRSARNDTHSEPNGETGRKKQTHLRRGHWHHYWTGPLHEPEKRELILKWTAPTIINPPKDGEPELDIVVSPVKK